MLEFKGRILIIGYGAVSQCTIPILLRHVTVPCSKITVMDFEDKAAAISRWREQGVTFVRDRVTPENLASLLDTYLAAGDLLIDLAWNIDTGEIIQWCHDRGVLYVNASIEVWNPYVGASNKPPQARTLYWRHMRLRERMRKWTKKGPTAVLDHGANPGLISHWTKQGLLDIAERGLTEKKWEGPLADEIAQHARSREFNYLAMKMGVKVIHCSEDDTQVTNVPKEPDEFVNTWSIEGFREEGTTTAEMGWGTHERWLPPLAHIHTEGPRNQICLARMGMNTMVASWVPGHTIYGMIIRHGEAYSIAQKLTVTEGDELIYRPTVHYAYCPSDAAIASLHELRGRDYVLQPRVRIMTDEITAGEDILGALIMGHPYQSWWTGSNLSIEETRRIVPGQNATTLQVAAGVVTAVMWMIENPRKGVCLPDDLPHDYVLGIARAYLGTNISTPADWNPLLHYTNHFHGFNSPVLDRSDPWQFCNFLITDGD